MKTKKLKYEPVKTGRPMSKQAIVEHGLMEMLAIACSGACRPHPSPETVGMFRRLAAIAHFTQGVHTGVKTPSHEFNQNLLQLLGEEN